MEIGTSLWSRHTHLMGKIPLMGGTYLWIPYHIYGYVEYL